MYIPAGTQEKIEVGRDCSDYCCEDPKVVEKQYPDPPNSPKYHVVETNFNCKRYPDCLGKFELNRERYFMGGEPAFRIDPGTSFEVRGPSIAYTIRKADNVVCGRCLGINFDEEELRGLYDQRREVGNRTYKDGKISYAAEDYVAEPVGRDDFTANASDKFNGSHIKYQDAPICIDVGDEVREKIKKCYEEIKTRR